MSVADTLLDWYLGHRRVLPWRQSIDPYRVWVSEVMLQQTRVDTVIPYYERFLERFPSVKELAGARVEELLSLWSGLGYYRRGRLMHEAAGQLAQGGFPTTIEGWLALPGVGEYTAAAVASIAFGVEAPVVDGNVERVLARFWAIEGDLRGSGTRTRLRDLARDFLVPGRPGDSNQALMELGATVCLPQQPRCLLCPLNGSCRALAERRVDELPAPRRRRAQEQVLLAVAVVSDGPKVLMFRRPADSELLGGTWELPWVDLQDKPNRRAVELGLAARYGGAWRLGASEKAVRHAITHRSIRAAVHSASLLDTGAVAEGVEAGWFSAEERMRLPVSSLVGKVLAAELSEGFRHPRRRKA